MDWAFRRQIIYFLIFFAVVFLLGFLIIYPYFNKKANCSDGKQNGTETGIDCGGSCVQACNAQLDDLEVLWTRTFKVVKGRYNAIAYLENKNENAAIYKIKYRFRFADKDNIYVAKREGETFIPASGKFAIFEPAINVGNSIPVYSSFEFTETPVWVQIPARTVDQLKIFTSDLKLEDEDTRPILSATIKNGSLFRIPEVSFVTILYDEFGNAVSASKTYLDMLMPEETKEISFTWPEKFEKKIVSKEIIPMYNIFLVKLN